MTYVCIRCRSTWVVGEASAEVSGGLCDCCITEYVRCKQKNNGFHDCFKRATQACSETSCSYWEVCNRQFANSREAKGKR
jgi:hypothetical protein